jgi:hypothetical protein
MVVHLAKHHVRASDQQIVTVTGLAAGERVTVTYQGKRISSRSAHASTVGRYRVSFKVDTVWGAKTVDAVGGFPSRRDTDTFQVVRRCAVASACV